MNNDVRQALQQAQKAITTQRVQGLISVQQGGTNPGMDLALPQRQMVPKSLDYVAARENRGEFYEIWVRKIEAFVKDPEQKTLELPAELNSNDRRELHNLAGNFNLAHTSAGAGPTRRLVLSKDDLFYRARGLMINKEGIVALKSADTSKAGSRYHLRRVTSSAAAEAGAIGSYQDESVREGYEQLRRATNAFENAYNKNPQGTLRGPGAMEQLKALAGGNNAPEASKAAAPTPQQAASAIQKELASWTSGPTPSIVSSSAQSTSTSQPTAVASTAENTYYEEQCTVCGSGSELDYDVSEWECVGMCDTCGTEGIFRLVQKQRKVPGTVEEIEKEDPVAAKRARSEEGGDADKPNTSKGARVEAAQPAPQAAEEEDDEEIEATTDDTIAIAESNDMSHDDVQWIRTFCEDGLQGDAKAIGAQVVFAMSYGDVTIPRRIRTTIPVDEQLFVKVQAGSSGSLCTLLNKLVSTVFGLGSEKTTVVILPNMSVAGMDAEAVVFGRVGSAQRKALDSLRADWGSKGISFGTTLNDDGPH